MSDLYWLSDAQMAKLNLFSEVPWQPRVYDKRVLSA